MYYSATNERPIFLSWPLPENIGVERISMYPNTPWTWHFLGLNPAYQCPPAFGYLDDVSSWAYWRDRSIPEKTDRARADPHDFQLVECYSTDGPAGTNGHEATDIKASAGTPVYAAAGGKVAGWNIYGLYTMLMLKHCLGGVWDENNACVGGQQWYTTYMHINLAREFRVLNEDVARGTQIATVYDQTLNSHLHFEVGLDKRLYANFVNPWGRDQAPWDGCMWQERARCPYPDPAVERTAWLDASATLSIREAGLNSPWVSQAQGLVQIGLAGRRVALLDRDGTLLIKEGSLSEVWVRQPGRFRAFQLAGRRIAAIDTRGALQVKAGLYDDWLLLARQVRAVSLSANRVGFVNTAGDLYVQEDGPAAGWVFERHAVRAFQLTDHRVAVLDAAGDLDVKDDSLVAAWVQVSTRVRAFQVSDRRIAVLDENGNLMIKEGDLSARWTGVASRVRAFEFSDARLVFLDEGGVLWSQDGSRPGWWNKIFLPGLQDFQLNGPG